jgi:signal transduction histidine kinase
LCPYRSLGRGSDCKTKIMADTDPIAELTRRRKRFWRYARILVAPLLLWGLVVVALRVPLQSWLDGEKGYDEAVLHEWLDEARGYRGTLREMIEDYLARAQEYVSLSRSRPDPTGKGEVPDAFKLREIVAIRHEEIYEQLRTLGSPPTKRDAGQLPLFPIIYQLQIHFHLHGTPLAGLSDVQLGDDGFRLDAPISWDSGLPTDASQYQVLEHDLKPYATISVRYQLHAYNKRQRIEQAHHQRLNQLSALAIAGTVLSLTWMVIVQRRERERERRHAETERQLLEQRLATQAAERQALELKSQMWANIGIMAGSYAHNIKNLLVRPNDLLRRCLDAGNSSPDQATMLNEVQHTLGTVTERLQQILHTVRRDPSHAETARLDLNAVVVELEQTWKELAREKWKLELLVEIHSKDPLWISGDISHLQQAIENLLFNARDASFEMRNHLRDRARQATGLDAQGRRQALISAAAWRGRVVLRTFRREQEIVLEVCDTGAGMTDDVCRRCTETHFSTKRDNAIYEGHSTGMGLGLSFVVAILEHHRARLEIDSEPLCGTTFRIRFPAADNQASGGRQPPVASSTGG